MLWIFCVQVAEENATVAVEPDTCKLLYNNSVCFM